MSQKNIITNEDREKRITFVHYLRALIREPVVLIAAIFLIIIIMSAVFADIILAYDPLRPNILAARLAPFSESKGIGGMINYHLLGTDALGRDMLTRLIFGARVSISVGIISVIFAGTVGTFLGLIAGYYGRTTETVIMRTVDGFMAVPSLLIALPLITARMVSPSSRARSRSLSTTIPAPLENIVPSPSAENARVCPSGENIIPSLNRYPDF